MKGIEPKLRCAVCTRGVLNRSAARCLYCGAELPPEVRLAPEAIAQREAGHARMEVVRARLARRPPQQADGGGISPVDAIDGIGVGADIVDMLGDGISAIGDLLS